MLVSNPSPLKMRNVYPWITLDKIRHTMGWTEKELAHSLELTEARFRALQQKGAIPSVHSIGALSQRVGLSFDAIMLGHVDYQVLRDRVEGRLASIPERFEVGAFSKRRTSINLLTCIEDVYGWDTRKAILDHFQLTELAFSDPDSNISLQFPIELTEFLVKRGYPTSLFSRMGIYSLVTNKNGELGTMLSKFDRVKELYEYIVSEVTARFYDQNCKYRILSLDEAHCEIEAITTESFKEIMKSDRSGNRHTCEIRGGSFASMSGYIDMPLSSVTHTECVHRGDSRCVYRIDFSSASQANH